MGRHVGSRLGYSGFSIGQKYLKNLLFALFALFRAFFLLRRKATGGRPSFAHRGYGGQEAGKREPVSGPVPTLLLCGSHGASVAGLGKRCLLAANGFGRLLLAANGFLQNSLSGEAEKRKAGKRESGNPPPLMLWRAWRKDTKYAKKEKFLL